MKKIYTIALIALLLVGFAGAITPAIAQATPDPIMRVAWQVANETEQFAHSQQHSDWVFGPQPEIWIEYDNGSDIAENNYRIEVGMDLTVNMFIPKSFLGVGNDLDVVQFWGTGLGTRAATFGLEYNATSDRWNSVGFRYVPGSDEPRAAQFIALDSLNSNYTEETDHYEVVFAITYAIALPNTILTTGMQVIDTDGKPVSSSWLTAATEGRYGSPPLGLGMAVSPLDFSLPNYYYADIVDETGRVMHYADVNDTFIFRMMSTAEFGSTLIPLTDAITYDDDYKITVNWTYPETMDTVGLSVLFNSALEFNTSFPVELRPAMALKINASGAYPVAGYLDLDWEWLDLGGGLGMWFPHLTVIENSTIDITKYYVEDSFQTGVFDEGHRVQWAGYFTNETDLDPSPQEYGGMIEPEMGLVTVLDADGMPIIARPEISERQTIKLSFRSTFIEAFVFNDAGNIANTAQQGETLNLTLLVHRDVNLINGSVVYVIDNGAEFNLTSELKDMTIKVEGSIMDGNATHYWRIDITHSMVLDFEMNTSTTLTVYRVSMYEIGTGLLWSLPVPQNHWTVSDFDITLSEDLTTLIVEFNFNAEALDMVINKASIKVGLIQNLRWWNETSSAWELPNHLNGTLYTVEQYNALVALWTDNYQQLDISSDTLWSPRHLRLGDVYSYTPPIWKVTEEGAIDLDGNFFTEDDQYFVKRTGYWEDWGNVTVDGMWVGVGFDPTPGTVGDEFWSENWMGVVQQNIWFEANETFYWYHASDFTSVNASEMTDIQDLLWADYDNAIATPGYDHVSWLSKNWTLDTTTVPGLEAGRWSTTWFAWGTTQNFWVAIEENQATLAHFRAQYAGLLIFNDGIGPSEGAPDFSIERGQVVTEEVTHYVLIDEVGDVELRRPFGATNSSGNVLVSPDTEVEFGITISDVDVTIYPLKVEHSSALRGAWDFRQSYEGVIGLNQTNFDYRISSATITEMAFDIHFTVDQVTYDAEDPLTWNNAVSFNVDQTIGDWTLNDIDDSVLDGRSLAVNFFGVLATGTVTQRTAGERPVTDSNGASQDADYYLFGSENSPYANVEMGGLPYTWGGDGHSTTYYSGSSTAPIGAFSLMYESASGSTVTNWQVDASMLFMTAGYENWGGEDIICDPVFVAYTSAFQSASTGTTTYTGGEGDPAVLYLIVGGVVALIVIVCVMYRRR
ncbi:MAG: hypothetical protein E4H14_01035 [Candidatus Thorarchaeota archaeon]|nr:MAG: hypothetical protein E4H14_01035 [Candidatus Thorarchaeota archaeon]